MSIVLLFCPVIYPLTHTLFKSPLAYPLITISHAIAHTFSHTLYSNPRSSSPTLPPFHPPFHLSTLPFSHTEICRIDMMDLQCVSYCILFCKKHWKSPTLVRSILKVFNWISTIPERMDEICRLGAVETTVECRSSLFSPLLQCSCNEYIRSIHPITTLAQKYHYHYILLLHPL